MDTPPGRRAPAGATPPRFLATELALASCLNCRRAVAALTRPQSWPVLLDRDGATDPRAASWWYSVHRCRAPRLRTRGRGWPT